MLGFQESVSTLGLSSAGDRTEGFLCDACVLDKYYIPRAFSEARYMILLTTFNPRVVRAPGVVAASSCMAL